MSLEVFQIAEEVALITGGGTGIGLAIATCFVNADAKVVLVGRREAPLRNACEKLGEAATFHVHDVTQRDAAEPLIRQVERDVGPVSILVNNAGIHLKKPAVETSAVEFDAVLQTHVIGSHELVRVVLPGMIQRQRGNILFIASMGSLMGIPLVTAYSAAKSAYLGMIRCLAVEASPHGVRVNGIAPGWIDTPMSRQAVESDKKRKDRVLDRTPMRQFGMPEDIGWAATYLCSEAARFVTGAVLPVDGGMSIGF